MALLISLAFALLLAGLGLSDKQIGLVLTLTLIGDAATLMRTRPTLRETPGLGSLEASSARGCDAASRAPYEQGLTGVDWRHMEGINHGASTADRH
jgi:hypothetical protein